MPALLLQVEVARDGLAPPRRTSRTLQVNPYVAPHHPLQPLRSAAQRTRHLHPVKPRVVVEVDVDSAFEDYRWRHACRFVRASRPESRRSAAQTAERLTWDGAGRRSEAAGGGFEMGMGGPRRAPGERNRSEI
jgi:hypothetical protein